MHKRGDNKEDIFTNTYENTSVQIRQKKRKCLLNIHICVVISLQIGNIILLISKKDLLRSVDSTDWHASGELRAEEFTSF